MNDSSLDYFIFYDFVQLRGTSAIKASARVWQILSGLTLSLPTLSLPTE